MEHSISSHWDGETILLSYCIAITGSYCTIQLMEQWRLHESRRGKLVLMLLSSVALGGCGIWSMHFTGMQAMQMQLDDGTILEVNFEGVLTVLSLIFPIMGVFIGLFIASSDPFFLEVEASRRKDLLGKDLKKVRMDQMVKKDAISRKIKYIALFSRLWHILGGGFFAALGVLGMHYLGMMAQRTNATMKLNADVVALSSIIAFFTANAAFWIIFRALTFWPHFESLRLGSALIMGVAVCGTHYSGMGAATYTYTEENHSDRTRWLLRGQRAVMIASHGSLLICFWLSTFAVMVSMRKNLFASITSNKSAVHPEGARTTVHGGANRHTTKAPTQHEHAPLAVTNYSQGPPSEGVHKFTDGVNKQQSSTNDNYLGPVLKDVETSPATSVRNR